MFKHAFAAFIAFWGLNSAAVAQTASGGACSLPSIVDTAPLEQIAGTDLMTVPVEINGSAEHFLLDIGTGQTEIAQTTVAKAGLPANPKRTETIGGERGPIMQGLPMGGVDLGSLTNGGLGNVSVHDVRDNSGSGARETRVRISSFTIGRANNRNMMFLVANDAEMGSSSD